MEGKIWEELNTIIRVVIMFKSLSLIFYKIDLFVQNYHQNDIKNKNILEISGYHIEI